MDGKVIEQRAADGHRHAPRNSGLTPERLAHSARMLADTITAMLEIARLEKLGQYRDH